MASDANLQLIVEMSEEFVRRRNDGESPTIEEYVNRHPELATEIRDCLEAIDILGMLNQNTNGAHPSVPAQLKSTSAFPAVDDYEIVREIARGGMGIVYEARQISLHRQVALKVLPVNLALDETATERFQREARSAAMLHHTNIVPVFDVGNQANVSYYAMQLIHGTPLHKVIQEIKRLKSSDADAHLDRFEATIAKSMLNQARRIDISDGVVNGENPDEETAGYFRAAEETRADDGDDSSSTSWSQTSTSNRKTFYANVAQLGFQVADALRYAHRHGIIHRDIKPSNLLLDVSGNVWVTDFGLAKTEDDGLTKTGDVVGTLRYMAPERFEGKCDARSDVYSLGMTLYELVTQTPAFESQDQLSLLQKIRNEDVPPIRFVDSRAPRDLQTIISKAIEKEPRRRYASAHALAEDLSRFVDGRPIKARRVSYTERMWIWSRRNPVVAGLLSALVVGVVLALVGAISAAMKFREMAIVQQGLATAAKASEKEAIRSAKDLKRSLYQSDMRLAIESLSGPGGIPSARSRLANWRPELHDSEDYRGWEWYCLSSLAYRETVKISANWITDVDFSPDGSRFAFTNNGAVLIYDTESQQRLGKISGFKSRANDLRFNQDGDRIVVLSGLTGKIAVLDVATGKKIAAQQHQGHVGEVSWDADNRWIAYVGQIGKQAYALHVLDVESSEITPHSDRRTVVDVLDVSPDGGRIALFFRGCISIVDTKSWQETRKRKVNPIREVKAIRWSPDGERLAVAATRSGVIVWDLKDDSLDRLVAEGTIACVSVDWDPTGRFVAAGNRQRSIHVWDTARKKMVDEILGSEEVVHAVSWSSSGDSLVSVTNKAARLWNLGVAPAHRKVPVGDCGWLAKIGWHSNGSIVIGGETKSLIFQEAELETSIFGETPTGVDFGEAPCCGVIDASGQWRASSQGSSIRVNRVDGSEPKDLLQHLGTPYGKVFLLAWSPTGRKLLFSRRGGTAPIGIYDMDNERIVQPEFSQGIRCCAWHPEGNRIVVCSNEALYVYDLETKEKSLHVEVSKVDTVRFSPDGNTIAFGGRSSVITLLDAHSGSILRELSGHIAAVRTIAWSPDGRRLASVSGERNLLVWSPVTGQCTMKLLHDKGVIGVGWAPDSKRLATVTEKGFLNIWDARRAYESESGFEGN